MTETVAREEYNDFRDDLREDLRSFKTDIRRELLLMFAAAVPTSGFISGILQTHLGGSVTHAALAVAHIF